jgi:hypothetical protein
MFPHLSVVVRVVACVLLATTVNAQERVDMKTALAHVVKRVEPVWPAETRGTDARQAVQPHEEFPRVRGDASGAAEMERRASALTLRYPAQAAPSRTTRRFDGITIVELKPEFITGEDVREIRRLIAPKRAWWIAVDEAGAEVCTEPDTVTATVQRGTCVSFAKSAAGTGRAAGWIRDREAPHSGEFAYLRVPQDGTDPATQPPIRLSSGDLPVPPDQTIADAVRFVRSKAIARPTGKLKNDVQPYPVETVLIMRDQQFALISRNPEATAGQMITVKRQGDGWEIVELR